MSTRRAVRPDSQVYRQTRRMNRRRRSVPMTAAYICLALVIVVALAIWLMSRHGVK